MDFLIAPSAPQDATFLWTLLRDAALEANLPPLSPENASLHPFGKYLSGWPRPNDGTFVAFLLDGTPIGAAWYRLFPSDAPGYGFIAADIPEVTIRLHALYRRQGAGGALLDSLAALARQRGFAALSLSVDRQNPAQRLYLRHGYVDARVSSPDDTSLTMVASLAD
jgi:GNAT superfamily N-acetyltransferase